MKFRIPHLY